MLRWPWRRKRRPPPPKPQRFTHRHALLLLSVIALASFAAGAAWRAARAASPRLSGPARVVDGDTLVVAGATVRLKGVDAPESGQPCYRAAATGWLARPRRPYDCGAAATRALAAYLRHRRVTCVGGAKGGVPRDKYGRRLARCHVRRWGRDVDVGLWLLQRGHAVVYGGGATQAYRAAEADAKRRRVGVWGGSFEAPALWRAKREARAVAARVDRLRRAGT